jgi:hypothetical protein
MKLNIDGFCINDVKMNIIERYVKYWKEQ